MAENAGGITSVLVKTGQGGADNKYVVNPTYVCEDLKEAVETVLNRDNGRKRQ